MEILYTSTICISAERSPILGQIRPILGKLQHHFSVTEEDSLHRPSRSRAGMTSQNDTKCSIILFISCDVNCFHWVYWENQLLHYVFVLQDESIRQVLEEGTALDQRFKTKVADAVWNRLEVMIRIRLCHSISSCCVEHSPYLD